MKRLAIFAILTLVACNGGGAFSDADANSAARDASSGGTEIGVVDDDGGTPDPGTNDADNGGTDTTTVTNPDFEPEPMPDCVVPADVESPTATIYSVASGEWSDPNTWNTGAVPAEGEDVHIRHCDTVTYDVAEGPSIHTILVNGTLSFSRTSDTTLDVGLLAIANEPDNPILEAPCSGRHRAVPDGPHTATLEVGTPSSPIPADISAQIRLTSFDDLDPECAPGIINAAARMEFHGAPLERTWAKLAATAEAGSSSVTLAAPVDDWRVGDRVIVTPTEEPQGNPHRSFIGGDVSAPKTEERVITAINGAEVTLDTPLEHDHQGDPEEGSRRTEMGNLSRNVTVSSMEPDGIRGHTMYHHGSKGSISYAEFRSLGKSDTLGRYPGTSTSYRTPCAAPP